MAPFPPIVAPLAVASGMALHLLYFNRGEHHMYGIRYMQVFVTTFLVAVATLTVAYDVALKSSLAIVSLCTGYVSVGLFSSLLCYRLFWHPLRGFPGPLGARISSLWLTLQNTKAENHRVCLDLYNRYGPFVRIGSSELMIVHPKAVPAIYGAQSACSKAAFYDEDYPRESIHMTRNAKLHHERRRIWSQAFSDRALRGYESHISTYNAALVSRLAEFKGAPANAPRWFNYYSFDVMGDLAFGRDFGMLSSGQQHWAIALLDEAFVIQGLKLPVWVFRMLTAVPGLTAKYWSFIEYCNRQLTAKIADERRNGAEGRDRDDLMSLLIAHADAHPSEKEQLVLHSESRTAIVAGSDTTAATLSHIFYYLARYPEHTERLRRELSPLTDDGRSFEYLRIQSAEHLNGVINEALRLCPVLPTMLPRKTPPEGIHIDGTFVPGNMDVWAPMYVLGRSEAVYERPEEFIPERWYSQPSLVKDKAGFAPFSLGPYGCIGRPLAQMQIRTLMAQIVMRFDVEFPPGQDGSKFIENTKDRFTLGLADLDLCFKPRN
ncbi:putative cytochrome P450 monooxygenase [Biscogniauxia mediterranea]|nr:putative cytochrome P450 monooxygenase [Biscogniauxia mediterranea]